MNSDTLSVVFLSFCILPSEDEIYIGIASLTLGRGSWILALSNLLKILHPDKISFTTSIPECILSAQVH